jgi:hypothetical protein
MSRAPFDLSPDLKRLRDEGYFVQIRGGLLVMREVPYVDASRQVRTGTLISSLNMAGDVAKPPTDTHQVWFDGDFPCKADGSPLKAIEHSNGNFDLGHGLTAKHHLSSKPDNGYPDYYAKMTTYAGVISGPAGVIKPDATARIFREPEEEGDGVFNYIDTASSRVGIGALAERLSGDIVSIIGLGGSGSYILDFVAKTPVREIRLFDADEFLQHNAFRAPGAPTIDELRRAPLKVEYLKATYSRMHRNIVAHEAFLGAANLQLLDGTTFAFLSMDAGEPKRLIVERLEELGVPFIDVGMGLELVDGALGGILRMTASTPGNRGQARKRISFSGGGPEDIYATNIQVADLNALNAVLAVIKWKKLRGFYHDAERELHCSYTTDGNQLENGDVL